MSDSLVFFCFSAVNASHVDSNCININHQLQNQNYYDSDRQCQVYFPTYYPDGDYYFFFDGTWNYGIFGQPWRNEIIIMGKELIKRFEKNKEKLGLELY